MRTDCTIDRKQIICSKSSLIGYSTNRARIGSFLIYADSAARDGSDHRKLARMLGRVHADGKTYILAMALSDSAQSAYERWIAPDDVLECYDNPPTNLAAFFFGTLPPRIARDPQMARRLMDHGTISEQFIGNLSARIAMLKG